MFGAGRRCWWGPSAGSQEAHNNIYAFSCTNLGTRRKTAGSAMGPGKSCGVAKIATPHFWKPRPRFLRKRHGWPKLCVFLRYLLYRGRRQRAHPRAERNPNGHSYAGRPPPPRRRAFRTEMDSLPVRSRCSTRKIRHFPPRPKRRVGEARRGIA